MTDQEKYADKIAKLLAKAESTTPQEAELLVEKAQQLQTEYAISEAMIAKATGKGESQKIIREDIVFTGVYAQTHFDIAKCIAKANECRVIYAKDRRGVVISVIGFEEDVARTRLMNSSLQIQAQGALAKWWGEEDRSWMSGAQKFKDRREFLFSFGRGLNMKLAAAAAAGRKAAAEKFESKETSAEEATESVALVVREKKDRVNDWVDQTYGRLSTVSRNYSSGGYGAAQAGRNAGLRANTNKQGTVGGRSRELGR